MSSNRKIRHTKRIQFYKNRIACKLLVLLFCYPVFAFKAQPYIIITNNTSIGRVNEIITISKERLGLITKSDVPVFKQHTKVLTSQTIDLNSDGIWDELLIEVSIGTHATDTLQVSWVKKANQIPFKKVTNVRLSLRSDNATPSAEINTAVRYRGFTQNIAKPYYQMEGPGIENDKVAFRAFFDYRNGKDIYGKIVDTPILESVGVGSSWHELQLWGMDIFHTGNSLSAGGLAVEENKQIYRLGDADTSTFQALYEGPLQAALKLTFKNWDAGTEKKNGSETVSITKGDFFYKNDIALSLNKLQKLIAGIANFGIDQVVYKKHNTAFSSISTYGNQAEGTQTKLGLAILFASKDYLKNKTVDTASVIPNTSYVVLQPGAADKKTIYFFACWEKSDARFSTQQGFENYLHMTAMELANPIEIKIILKK